jgi:hypothetical protein
LLVLLFKEVYTKRVKLETYATETVVALLQLAQQYYLLRVVEKCERHLIDAVNHANVTPLAVLSKQYECHR